MSAKRDEGIMSPRAPDPVGPYPHARRAGHLLFLSGIGPRTRGSAEIPGVTRDAGGRIVSHDIAAQCRAAFQNVRAVLEDAGSSWDRIVDVTVYLTDDALPIYNRVYAEQFTGIRPARTTVQVSRLPTDIAIELKVIATID